MIDLLARVLPPKGAGFVIFGLGSWVSRTYGHAHEELDLHHYLLHLPLSFLAVGPFGIFPCLTAPSAGPWPERMA
ncbi:hypothetical protein LY39_01515 [Roseinatronobacter bogoriensis subsp. barguzinensis]|uniref:Uncharacterized protein n=1 Tax=Roseinatronobacter bogoriensis subsp. barguzinensis TaxID=441209 RepID=A0A2K8K9J5_9RHOB|nr:hypothetical protein [Rhodobaca barguzinensis]ATX66122.1 hypothetical protein BG454_10085 [Rhodobaca barguzinensis]MBB4207153.1 hypothetical protein [Rhodobaca bogoriensis DSM 18756]TDW40477.1 hypothetical protein LY39_01515 [Rhodobaca barguzinensis]TDY70371.1 hypothetical protein EV660_10242 [Rhodobaca bogoriensis DSM 18756]